MNTLNETLSGFVPTRSLVGSGKDKQPYKEKSKSKDRRSKICQKKRRKTNVARIRILAPMALSQRDKQKERTSFIT